MTHRQVAIFDADLPPCVAFTRSLARVGVPPTVYVSRRHAAGRYSRYALEIRDSPDVAQTDDFVDWLCGAMDRGQIDLVAPTSDVVTFCVAEAHERLGRHEEGHPTAAAIRNCLFKDWFAEHMEAAGFPTPPWSAPTSVEESLAAANRIGYPIVLKPRSHVVSGNFRGYIVHTPDELAQSFGAYVAGDKKHTALERHPRLSLPILQRYFSQQEIDIVSVVGCLASDGRLLSLGHCRKLRAWPPGLGIGTRFEALDDQSFSQRAVDAVRQILGCGLFELEILVHRTTGEVWPLDLNPRGYGQISLEIARGHDLPLHWYESVTGVRLESDSARRVPPRYWQAGVYLYAGALSGLVTGPHRLTRLAELAAVLREPRVGPFLDRRDPLPAIVTTGRTLRHLGGLFRPYFSYRGEIERTR